MIKIAPADLAQQAAAEERRLDDDLSGSMTRLVRRRQACTPKMFTIDDPAGRRHEVEAGGDELAGQFFVEPCSITPGRSRLNTASTRIRHLPRGATGSPRWITSASAEVESAPDSRFRELLKLGFLL